MIRNIFKNERGQTLAEYLIVAVFLAVIFSFLFRFTGVYLRSAFRTAASIILGVYG